MFQNDFPCSDAETIQVQPIQRESAGCFPGYPWYAIRVRSRHERPVSDSLKGKGLDTFLPLCKSRRRWSDRVQEVELPLFPGYVFSRFDVAQRLPVLITPGVVNIIGLGKIPVPVEDWEMQSLIRVVQSGVHCQLWPFLMVGQRVLIEEGPLRSVEGRLVQIKDENKLILSITLLQRSVAVTVDRSWIRPLPDAHTTADSRSMAAPERN